MPDKESGVLSPKCFCVGLREVVSFVELIATVSATEADPFLSTEDDFAAAFRCNVD